MTEVLTKGNPVVYWSGVRAPGIAGKLGILLASGTFKFGGTDCYRVRREDGASDYIAATHVEPAEPLVTRVAAIIQDAVEMTPYWTDDPATHQDPHENAALALLKQGFLKGHIDG